MKKRDKKFEIVSSRLRELRKKAGLSNERLSEILKEKYDISISKITLQKYEVTEFHHTHYGSVEGMRLEYLYMFADFYGVSVDYLVGRANIPTTDTNMEVACNFTGLSQEAIEKLNVAPKGTIHKRILNLIIENESFQEVVNCIVQTVVNSTILKKTQMELGRALPLAIDVLASASPDDIRISEQCEIACQSAKSALEYRTIAESFGMDALSLLFIQNLSLRLKIDITSMTSSELWEVRYSKAVQKLRDSIITAMEAAKIEHTQRAK